jgi:hypothetical protein
VSAQQAVLGTSMEISPGEGSNPISKPRAFALYRWEIPRGVSRMTRNSSVAVHTPSMSQSVFEQRIVNGLPSSRSIWHARLLGVASANTAVIAENAQSKRFACVAYDVAGNPAASMTRRYVEPISTRCDWRRRQSPTVTSDGLICMFTTFRGDGACRRRVRRSNRRAWRTLRLRISSLSAYLQVSPAGWKRCRLRGFR